MCACVCACVCVCVCGSHLYAVPRGDSGDLGMRVRDCGVFSVCVCICMCVCLYVCLHLVVICVTVTEMNVSPTAELAKC